VGVSMMILVGVGVGGTRRIGSADRMVPATMLKATTRPKTQKIICCLRCFGAGRRFRAKSSSKRDYTITLIPGQILTSRLPCDI
jgi:hypothetical protein